MNYFKNYFLSLLFLSVLFFLSAKHLQAQDVTNVQIKVFDKELNPVPSLQIKIDNLQPLRLGSNGVAFQTIPNSSLPPAKITFSNERIEAESWNYSKGTLEIIVRQIKERRAIIKVLNRIDGTPVSNLPVYVNQLRTEPYFTDERGNIILIVPIDASLETPDYFKIEGYLIANRKNYERGLILEVDKILNEEIIADAQLPTSALSEDPEAEKAPLVSNITQSPQEEIKIEQLDSINSLTVLFSLIKKIDFKDLDSATQQKLDDKFYELSRLNTLSALITTPALELINDSSIINDDLLLLIEKIQYEGELLNAFRDEFELATEQIKSKLEDGGENLSDDERKLLVQLILNLKELLRKNEEQFYQNNAYYQQEIQNLQSQLSDILELEDLLIETEEEKQKFREQLIYTSLTLAASIGLVLLLIFLVRIFVAQRKELERAKEEIEKMNFNLSELVAQKTNSLEKINKELDTFLYRSSHNLRRPVTSLKGLSNVAKLILDEEGLKLFEQVSSTSNDMEKMIDKLSMLNFIHRPTDFGEIDFEKIISNLKKKYSSLIQEATINFNYKIQPELKFNSYPIVLELLIQNLVENAVFYSKYTSSTQPILNISIDKDDDKDLLKLEVKDNGCGIDKAVRTKIWDMFFVGNMASKGNGLGLYMTKKAVDLLKGTIELKTKVGVFTTFRINLPFLIKEPSDLDFQLNADIKDVGGDQK